MAGIKTTFTIYGWAFKFVGAVLLIGLAMILYFSTDFYKWVEAFVGLLIAGYAIIRLVPFIKTQKSDLIKTINVVEIVLNLLVATVFIGSAFLTEDGLGSVFGYMFGAVLLARGTVHFYGVSDGHEKGDHPTFFFHIATLIIGTYVLFRGVDIQDIIILILLLALGAGGFIGIDAYGGYNLYRRRKQMEKPVQKDVPKPSDVPVKEDPIHDQDQIVS